MVQDALGENVKLNGDVSSSAETCIPKRKLQGGFSPEFLLYVLVVLFLYSFAYILRFLRQLLICPFWCKFCNLSHTYKNRMGEEGMSESYLSSYTFAAPPNLNDENQLQRWYPCIISWQG